MSLPHSGLDAQQSMTGSGRLSFLRTKRSITVIGLLVCVMVIIIALGLEHRIGPGSGPTADVRPKSPSIPVPNVLESLVISSSSVTMPTGSAKTVAPTKSAVAQPSSSSSSSAETPMPTAKYFPYDGQFHQGSIEDQTLLRIMPLGASEIRGERSAGHRGFRYPLRQNLTNMGSPVDMVGSQRLGDWPDNEHEGYLGFKVMDSLRAAQAIIPSTLPNIVLINTGINNAIQNKDVNLAGEDMRNLIDYILRKSPRSSVILSTLTTSLIPGVEPRILIINQLFRDIMADYEKDEKPVILAEVHYSTNISGTLTPDDIGSDLTHPIPLGYEKLAVIYTNAVVELDRRGVLQTPTEIDTKSNSQAQPKAPAKSSVHTKVDSKQGTGGKQGQDNGSSQWPPMESTTSAPLPTKEAAAQDGKGNQDLAGATDDVHPETKSQSNENSVTNNKIPDNTDDLPPSGE